MKVVVGAMAMVAAAVAGAVETGFTELFNGKDLAGWKVNGGSAEYAVEDGVIVGRCVPNTPGNTFLCTEREYENFILKVEYKIDSGNSGVQFRSSVRPEPSHKHGNRVYGYQAEITPNGDCGGRIYDEGRRGHVNGVVWLDGGTPQERLDRARAAFRPGDWNEMEIQCVGSSIKTWLNGRKVADLRDEVQQRGFFGLQVHAGEGCVVRWRNVRVRELPAGAVWTPTSVKIEPWMMEFVNRDVDGARLVQMPTSCSTPDGMCIDPKGRLVIAGANCADHSLPGAIYRLDSSDPASLPVKWFDVPACPGSDYTQPMGMTFGPKGELYVCDCQAPGKGRLLRFTFNADDTVASCETIAEGLANANGVKYHKGRLYLTQAMMPAMAKDGKGYSAIYAFSENDRNVKVSNTAADAQLLFGDVVKNPGRKVGLNGVAIDSKGNLYTGNYGDGHVWKLSLGEDGRVAKRETIALPTAENGLVSPDGMCVDANDNVYIADMFAAAVIRICPCGKTTVFYRAEPGASGPTLVRPSEPCVWRGRLYVANFGGTTLYELPLSK